MSICADLFIKNLESKNLKFAVRTADDGTVIVDFPYQGKVTKCIFSDENGCYFSLYLVYEEIPEEKFVDMLFVCNQLNAKYKWVTFYIDDEKNLILHDDAILSVDNAADEAFELLLRMVGISEESKPVIMKGIYA